MKAVVTSAMLAAAFGAFAFNAPAFAQQSPGPLAPLPGLKSSVGPSSSGSVVNTPRGQAVESGGTSSYQQLSGAGGLIEPNGNGTSTIVGPGGVQTVPTSR